MIETNNDDIERKWLAMIETSSTTSAAQELVSTFRNNEPCSVVQRFDKGAYNYCFKLRFDSDGKEWILRLPKPGQVMDPVKKITDEVAVMKFVHDKTTIPIPTIIAYGLDESSDLGLFIIMEFIEGTRLDQLLIDDNENFQPGVDRATWEYIHRQIAAIYLELWVHDFNGMGALTFDEKACDSGWLVRPSQSTFKTNEMERIGARLNNSGTPPKTTCEYFRDSIDQTILMLPFAFKNNDTRLSQSRALEAIKAAMPRFVSAEDITGPFKLFNRDFRLGNILVDKNWKITAVLDWEFSNVGPGQLACCPPSLLSSAELFAWDDQEDIVKHRLESEFKNNFDAFILLVREEEDRRGMDDSFSLRMSQCLEDGTLWFNLLVEEYMIWEHLLERACQNINTSVKF